MKTIALGMSILALMLTLGACSQADETSISNNTVDETDHPQTYVDGRLYAPISKSLSEQTPGNYCNNLSCDGIEKVPLNCSTASELTDSEIASWQTYRDEVTKFSFHYPATWFVDVLDSVPEQYSAARWRSFELTQSGTGFAVRGPGAGLGVVEYLGTIDDNTSLMAYVEQKQKSGMCRWGIGETVVGQYRTVYEINDSLETTYYIQKGQNIYAVTVDQKGDRSLDQTQCKIIASIEFFQESPLVGRNVPQVSGSIIPEMIQCRL